MRCDAFTAAMLDVSTFSRRAEGGRPPTSNFSLTHAGARARPMMIFAAMIMYAFCAMRHARLALFAKVSLLPHAIQKIQCTRCNAKRYFQKRNAKDAREKMRDMRPHADFPVTSSARARGRISRCLHACAGKAFDYRKGDFPCRRPE